MDGIRTYLISVTAVSMISVLASVLVRNSPLQKTVRLAGGLLILLVTVVPLLRLDMQDLSEQLASIAGREYDTAQFEANSNEQLRVHIKRTTQTYIENKARELGATIQAEVTLTDGEYPTPDGVTILGTLTVEQVEALSSYLTDVLNIPTEHQEWKLYGATE